jgi:hypothetical protein
MRKILNALVLLSVMMGSAFAGPVTSPDRPFTLRELDYSPLLFEYHGITTGAKRQSYYYPQRDSAWRRGAYLQDTSALAWLRDSSGSAFIAASPILAFDLRGGKALSDTIQGYEGGLYLRGFKDSLEFFVDARMFSEGHDAYPPRSWDREFLEVQGNKGIEGEIEYSSYSRFRGHFSLNMGWSRLDFARDVQHWGPGYYNNLSLNQFAAPYSQMSLETQVGPLTVVSLYGDLRIADATQNTAASMSDENLKARNLYGHRYELN